MYKMVVAEPLPTYFSVYSNRLSTPDSALWQQPPPLGVGAEFLPATHHTAL